MLIIYIKLNIIYIYTRPPTYFIHTTS